MRLSKQPPRFDVLAGMVLSLLVVVATTPQACLVAPLARLRLARRFNTLFAGSE